MQIIIPTQNFHSPFNEILNGIHGMITKSERRLLLLFERHCYKDGQIYPKQATIAYKLGLTVRQVRRLIVSLVKKGFLAVVKSSLVDRHIYGKGNRYHLLNHPAYGKMSPEMSSEKPAHTIYKNKYIKTKSGFNVVEWIENNQHKHGQAIIDALNTLTARWPSIRLPGQYAQKIINIQSGNYAETDYQAAEQQIATEINAGYAKIAETIGIELIGDKDTPTKETPQQIAARLNRQRNEILKRFG